MAGITKNGLFYYIDPKGQLMREEKPQPQKEGEATTTSSSSSPIFSVLYGSPVSGVAFNKDETLVALLCPADAATEVSTFNDQKSGGAASSNNNNNNNNKSVVRVLKVMEEGAFLGDLVDEIIVAEATEIVWEGVMNYIVVSKPHVLTTFLSFDGAKLKVFLKDSEGFLPFTSLQIVGLTNLKEQTVTFWDMQKNQSVEEYHLPNRRARKGSNRTVTSTCSGGNFSLAMNNDATVHATYITKGSVRHLLPMLAHFTPFCRRPRKNEVVYPFTGEYKVLCHPLSSSQLLIGVRGSPDLYRFKYVKKDSSLVPVEKMRIPNEEVVLALGETRYLATRLDPATQESSYVVCPLVLGPLPSQERADEKKQKRESKEGGKNNSNNNSNNNNNNNNVSNDEVVAAGEEKGHKGRTSTNHSAGEKEKKMVAAAEGEKEEEAPAIPKEEKKEKKENKKHPQNEKAKSKEATEGSSTTTTTNDNNNNKKDHHNNNNDAQGGKGALVFGLVAVTAIAAVVGFKFLKS